MLADLDPAILALVAAAALCCSHPEFPMAPAHLGVGDYAGRLVRMMPCMADESQLCTDVALSVKAE